MGRFKRDGQLASPAESVGPSQSDPIQVSTPLAPALQFVACVRLVRSREVLSEHRLRPAQLRKLVLSNCRLASSDSNQRGADR